MKRYWAILAARIDEMSLRQRAMLFATVSLVVIALAHTMLIEPVLVRQKALIDAVNRDQSQLTAVRAQIESILKEQEQGSKDPAVAALRELEARIAKAEKTLAERKQGFIAPTRLPALLRSLLGPGQAARLESLRVVPGTPVEGQGRLLPPRRGAHPEGQLLRTRAIPRPTGKAARAAGLGTHRAPGRAIPAGASHGSGRHYQQPAHPRSLDRAKSGAAAKSRLTTISYCYNLK